MKPIKRLFAVVVAATMVMGTSIVALADDPAPTQDITENKGVYTVTTTSTSTFKAPAVKVTVPTQPTVYLNPYGIKTKVDAVAHVNEALAETTNQITSPNYLIENYSNVPVKITASITTTATGASLLAKTAEVKDKSGNDLTTKWVKVQATITEKAKPTNKIEIDLGTKYDGKTDDTTVPSISITAADGSEKKADGTYTWTASPVVATMAFSGSLNDPSKVATSWTDTDSLKLVIKYDIKPLVQENATTP